MKIRYVLSAGIFFVLIMGCASIYKAPVIPTTNYNSAKFKNYSVAIFIDQKVLKDAYAVPHGSNELVGVHSMIKSLMQNKVGNTFKAIRFVESAQEYKNFDFTIRPALKVGGMVGSPVTVDYELMVSDRQGKIVGKASAEATQNYISSFDKAFKIAFTSIFDKVSDSALSGAEAHLMSANEPDTGKGVEERLKELEKLKQKKLITEKEYSEKRNQILKGI